MSEEALDVARRFAEGVQAREVPAGLVAVDCRIANLPTAVTDQTYHGRDGARKWLADLFDAFDENAEFEQEVIEAGDDHVVVRLGITGHGSMSGAPLELRWVSVLWFRDGVVTRAAGFANRREAFEALARERT